MTIVENYLADIVDIKSIRITCACGMSTSVPVMKAESLRLSCPSCDIGFFPEREDAIGVDNFIKGLQRLATSKKLKGTLQFEFPIAK
jgi:cellobiose-specific phosphotransferase system component IIB